MESHADAIATLNEQYRTQYAEIADRYHLLSARLHALQTKAKQGAPEDEDFTSKRGFAMLEAEYAAFKRFYDAQWKLAKAKIRQDKLSKKSKVAPPAETDQEKEADEQ